MTEQTKITALIGQAELLLKIAETVSCIAKELGLNSQAEELAEVRREVAEDLDEAIDQEGDA